MLPSEKAKLDSLEAEMNNRVWFFITADDWNLLGVEYNRGEGGRSIDRVKERLCYQKALELNPNHPSANYNIGLTYRLGRSVPVSLTLARAYFEKASRQNHHLSKEQLLILDLGQEMDRIYPQKTAEQWDLLGLKYDSGKDGRPKDRIKERLCYEQALRIDSNHIETNYHLGLIYKLGQGVERNLAKAKAHFQKSAEQGYERAKLELLKMEMVGKNADEWNKLGVKYNNKKDYVNGRLCYEESLKLDPNHKFANRNLAFLYRDGNGIEKNLVKAKALFQKAAKQGHEGANYQLGLMYKLGLGVQTNLTLAKSYFEKASRQNHKEATRELLKMEMTENNWSTANDWNSLGHKYYNEIDNRPEDYLRARICFEECLKLNPNHSSGNHNLGLTYQLGRGIEADATLAKSHLKKAAALGCKLSNHSLGLMHEFGQGVQINLTLAKSYYEKGSRQGHENSKLKSLKLEMNDVYPQKTANQWALLGQKYYYGGDTNTKDYVKARMCYEQALKINPNHSDANWLSGLIYEGGKGIKKDLEKAKKYFKKSENHGNIAAKNKLQEIKADERLYIYHLFLSHRGENKKEIAFPLVALFSVFCNKQTAFFDQTCLGLGESNTDKLRGAIQRSRTAMPIVGKNFCGSKWTILETKEFLERDESKIDLNILPLFTDTSPDKCRDLKASEIKDKDGKQLSLEEKQSRADTANKLGANSGIFWRKDKGQEMKSFITQVMMRFLSHGLPTKKDTYKVNILNSEFNCMPIRDLERHVESVYDNAVTFFEKNNEQVQPPAFDSFVDSTKLKILNSARSSSNHLLPSLLILGVIVLFLHFINHNELVLTSGSPLNFSYP